MSEQDAPSLKAKKKHSCADPQPLIRFLDTPQPSNTMTITAKPKGRLTTLAKPNAIQKKLGLFQTLEDKPFDSTVKTTKNMKRMPAEQSQKSEDDTNSSKDSVIAPMEVKTVKSLNPGRITPKRNIQSSQIASRQRYKTNTNRIYESIERNEEKRKEPQMSLDDIPPSVKKQMSQSIDQDVINKVVEQLKDISLP